MGAAQDARENNDDGVFVAPKITQFIPAIQIETARVLMYYLSSIEISGNIVLKIGRSKLSLRE